MVHRSRRQFALNVCQGGLMLWASGCGTLLYPERRGQPKGQLDWGVVALDGLGLLLFVVPGVIAFAVDFGTGAIYLPPSPTLPGYSGVSSPDESLEVLTEIRIPPEELTESRITAIASQHIGRPVALDSKCCRRVPLLSLREFESTRARVLAAAVDRPTQDRVRAQSR